MAQLASNCVYHVHIRTHSTKVVPTLIATTTASAAAVAFGSSFYCRPFLRSCTYSIIQGFSVVSLISKLVLLPYGRVTQQRNCLPHGLLELKVHEAIHLIFSYEVFCSPALAVLIIEFNLCSSVDMCFNNFKLVMSFFFP